MDVQEKVAIYIPRASGERAISILVLLRCWSCSIVSLMRFRIVASADCVSEPHVMDPASALTASTAKACTLLGGPGAFAASSMRMTSCIDRVPPEVATALTR